MANNNKPNILVIWSDDIGWQNVSTNGMGTISYTPPNVDRIGIEASGSPNSMARIHMVI